MFTYISSNLSMYLQIFLIKCCRKNNKWIYWYFPWLPSTSHGFFPAGNDCLSVFLPVLFQHIYVRLSVSLYVCVYRWVYVEYVGIIFFSTFTWIIGRMYVLELIFPHLMSWLCFLVFPYIYYTCIFLWIIAKYSTVEGYISKTIYIFLGDIYLDFSIFLLQIAAEQLVKEKNYFSRVDTEKWNHQVVVYVYFYTNRLSSCKAVPVVPPAEIKLPVSFQLSEHWLSI